MRLSIFLVAASLSLAAQASWFSGSADNTPAYTHWNTNELKAWLEVHNVQLPKKNPSQAELRTLVEENWNTVSAWTYDQYETAQKSFADIKETAFDSWDESRLREFLLEQGVVAPKGPKEHLVLLAKQKYRAYASAASTLSAKASATASSAIYGDKTYQASKSVTSAASRASEAAAQATKDAAKTFDQSKDYVYSTWDENQMRSWLEEKGLLKTKSQKKKDELTAMMHQAWGKVADPVWTSWSDSYIHGWLVSHNLIKSDYEKNRDALVKQMQKYYYSTTDTAFSTWSDSDLKKWLVQHDVIKSDAQVSRDKMQKMVEDNYVAAKDSFWTAWSDNQIRDYLIDHGYIRSNAQVKRDELVKLANEKYNESAAKTAAYLTWPDARLRAYLREHGIDDARIPGDRPSLLQETRIRWVQTQTRADTLFFKIKELVNSGIYKAEDVLTHLMQLLSGGWEETKEKTNEAVDTTKEKAAEAQGWAGKKADDAESWAEEKVEGAKQTVGQTAEQARQYTGEKVKVGGQKLKGEL